jgi:ABC-type Fe3+-hydroxamate transport system substrate-binding protein
MRRVPSSSGLFSQTMAGGGAGAGAQAPTLHRVGSNVSSAFAFGPLVNSELSAGSSMFRFAGRARGEGSAGAVWGASEDVASGNQVQWALHPAAGGEAREPRVSTSNAGSLTVLGAHPGGGVPLAGSNSNSRAQGGHMGPPVGAPSSLSTPRTPTHPAAVLVRDMTAPVFAIIDGEVLLPPATRPGLNRLLGDEFGTIVSLMPAATDVLVALGDAVVPRLQGITDLCEPPEEHAKHPGAHPPRVVSRSRVDVAHLSSAEVEAALRTLADRGEAPFVLDTAWLVAAAPSVVITQDLCGVGMVDPGQSVVARALSDARLLGPGSPTAVLVVRPRTLADALDAVLFIGSAVGAEASALALHESLQARLRRVASSVAAAVASGVHPRPRVLSLEGLKPLLTGGHWLPDMKALAGGCDDLQEAGASAERLRWEQVLSYNPDVLLVLPCNPSLDVTLSEVSVLAQQPGFWALTAVTTNQVYLLDHTRFSRPGPRLVDGVEVLARVLHPEAWPQEAPPGAVLKLAMPKGQRCRPHQLRQFFEEYR